MKRALFLLAVLVLGIGVLAIVPHAEAQSGGTYTLTWNAIDSGVMPSIGGSYTIAATIGQADAGTVTNGQLALNGGFWLNELGQTLNNTFKLYLPLIKR